jgi:hypothetical protein
VELSDSGVDHIVLADFPNVIQQGTKKRVVNSYKDINATKLGIV